MAGKIIDINYAKVEAYVQSKRPPVEKRARLDIGFRYDKNTYEIYERRPIWGTSDPVKYGEYEFVKIRYIKSREIYKLYWKRASGKWLLYDELPESTNLDQVLEYIDDDKYGCFYG